MRKAKFPLLFLTLTAALSNVHAASLQDAAKVFDVANAKSIEYTGTGRWFQFGQAPSPQLPWPQFDVSSYNASINFDTASSRVQIERSQTVEAGRLRPAPVVQRVDQYVSGHQAWSRLVLPNAAPGASLTATAQPAAAEERAAEIWVTPQGFLKAALVNNASSKRIKGGAEVAFTVDGKHRYVGTLNAKNQVERVKTWIDNPVLGDTLVETRFSSYKNFDGVQFTKRPGRHRARSSRICSPHLSKWPTLKPSKASMS